MSQLTGLPISLSKQYQLVATVIIIRILLMITAFIGANVSPLQGGIGTMDAPSSMPGIWTRFDSGYYLSIAQNGYDDGESKLAFLPFYPVLIHVMALGQSSLLSWGGFIISNLSFIAACVLLWNIINKEFSEAIAWYSVLTLAVFPTSFFFSAVYTEGVFLLLSVLVYWFSLRKNYMWAAVCVSLASITRVNGLLLIVIPLVEIVIHRDKEWLWQLIRTAILACLGLAIYCLYLWAVYGSPFAFINAQSNWERSLVLPWQSILDAVAVVSGSLGEPSDWFMRLISAQDFLAATFLLLGTYLTWRWLGRSLFVYMVCISLLMLISHGPYHFGLWSMARFVIVLFPLFIVCGILLSKFPRYKYHFWTLSTIFLVFYTAWFANGRWVA